MSFLIQCDRDGCSAMGSAETLHHPNAIDWLILTTTKSAEESLPARNFCSERCQIEEMLSILDVTDEAINATLAAIDAARPT